MRRTKIVATIGPACSTPETLKRLARAGVDGARLNLSHGTHEHHREWARLVRATEAELEKPIAPIADLHGPKLRIGDLEEPVSLRRGEQVVVAAAESTLNGELPVSPSVISEVLQRGAEYGQGTPIASRTQSTSARSDSPPVRSTGRPASAARIRAAAAKPSGG